MPEVPDHFFRQSAALPYRHRDGRLEYLLITSRRGRRWVIPKGVREPGLSAAESAAKEAFEEAGIEGRVAGGPVGSYEYSKWGGVCSVQVFPLQVRIIHPHWPESQRRRVWLGPEAAAARIDEPDLQRLLLDFARAAPGG